MDTETDIVNIQNFPILELVEIHEELNIWVSPFLNKTYALTHNGFKLNHGTDKEHSINKFCKQKEELKKDLIRIGSEKSFILEENKEL